MKYFTVRLLILSSSSFFLPFKIYNAKSNGSHILLKLLFLSNIPKNALGIRESLLIFFKNLSMFFYLIHKYNVSYFSFWNNLTDRQNKLKMLFHEQLNASDLLFPEHVFSQAIFRCCWITHEIFSSNKQQKLIHQQERRE